MGLKYRKRKNLNNNNEKVELPKTKTQKTISLILVGFLILGAIPLLFEAFDKFFSIVTQSYKDLSVSDTQQMKDVFFSGQPWFIMCDDQWKHLPKQTENVLSKIALKSNELNDKQQFNVGRLTCGNRLPSNKTIYERFNLSPYAQMFTVANGDNPKSVPTNIYQFKSDDSNFKTSIDEDKVVDKLFNHILRYTKQRKSFKVTTELQLRAQCLRKKFCGLLLYKEVSFTNQTKDIYRSIMSSYRTLHYAHMNWDKYALSFEDKLTQPNDGVDHNIRFLFFRQPTSKERHDDKDENNAKKTTLKPKPKLVMAKAYKDHFQISSMKQFLDTMINFHRMTTPLSLIGMKRFPSIMSRAKLKEQKEAETKRQAEQGSLEMQKRRQERQIKRKKRQLEQEKHIEDDNNDQQTYETKEERAARERSRREEMEKETKANIPEYLDDNWDDDEVPSKQPKDDEEDDEEVVDLD